METTFVLTPKQLRQRGTATQEQELRADPYHSRQRGASAGLLADIPGSIPDLLNIGADYFYSGLNSLLDVGDLSPYDIPRSLGIHPSQRQPIGPTSEQLEQSLTGAGLLAPTTGTPEETVSRVATGFAEGAPVAAVAGVIKKSPAFFSGLLSAAQKLPAKGTTQQMTKGLLKGGAKEAEIKEIGLDEMMGQDSPTGEDVAYRDNIVGFIEDNEVQLEEVIHSGEKTQYASHVEPGGEDYKELVLSLPDRTLDTLTDDGVVRSTGQNLPGRDHHWVGSLPQIENPVVHVRFNERVSPTGDDVLFMEEIQSDWANAGLRKGFGTKRRADLLEEVRQQVMRGAASGEGGRQALSHAEKVWDIYRRGDEGVPYREYSDAYEQVERYLHRGRTTDMSAEETLRWLDDGPPTEMMPQRRDGPVPDAPFVKNPNQWARLAMGRMLRYAADKGFDKLAWTTGETQAKRWAELKEIRELRFWAWEDGPNSSARMEGDGYKVRGLDGDGESVFFEDLSAAQVEKTFGAETLDRFRTEPLDGDSGMIEVDLKIGGEKKKRLYDQVYPNVMKKLVKKMGGEVKREVLKSIEGAKGGRASWGKGSGRLGTEYYLELRDGTRIRGGDGDDFASRSLTAGMVQGLGLHTQGKLKAVYDGTMDISELRLDRLLAAYKLEAWTVTIPRGWEKKIKEGLPLFSVPAAGLLGAQASDDQ